ncbi:MAG: hypothetical protein IT285_15345 [Bdellovibrionales bacterium]|nr:hypothetical protein [Bdellovibrionales bacterium]
MSISALSPSTALAEIDGRASFDLGIWWGTLKQEGFGQNAELDISPALGIQFALGLRANSIFIEWAPYWFFVQKLDFNDRNTADDVSYAGLGQLNAGWSLPFLPVDTYGGFGWGNWSFSTGTEAEFSGPELRIGAVVHLSGKREPGLHVRAEFRKMYPSFDDRGSLPSEVATTMNTVFLGIGFGPP